MKNKMSGVGSGNVFIDLGFSAEEAAELTLKSYLFEVLQQAVRDALKTAKQDDVAKIMGVNQPIISKILNDKIEGFSIERITSYLIKLRYDVLIIAQPAPANEKIGRIIDKRGLKNA